MNALNAEAVTNQLIAVIWPLLDDGESKEEIQAILNNVFDSWTPESGGS